MVKAGRWGGRSDGGKSVNGECDCGGGQPARRLLGSRTMTTPRISKLEAASAPHEASRRANEARAATRRRTSTTPRRFSSRSARSPKSRPGRRERLAQLRQQPDVEVAKKVDATARQGGAAVVRMQGRGETLTTIAARTDLGIGIVRTMLRHGPKPESPRPVMIRMHQVGTSGGGVASAPVRLLTPHQ